MIKNLKAYFSIFKNIYSDRKLLLNLSYKDFQRRFAGSYFGIVWGIVTPLLTMIVYWLVFQYGFRSSDIGDIPFILWFMCGIVPWLYISEAFPMAANSFIEYSYLIKKIVFNINILPMVKIVSALYNHLFFMGILAIICSVFGYYPTLFWLQLPYYLFCIVALVFAVSLIFATLLVFFRDLNQIIGVLLLIGMWGTPIAWNITMFPDKIQTILRLNPIYYIVEGYRDTFVSDVWFWERMPTTIYFWAVVFILTAIGMFLYNRLKSNFADVL